MTPVINDAIREYISDAAWEVGFEHDLLISTVVFTLAGVETGPWKHSPLVRTILKEGIAA